MSSPEAAEKPYDEMSKQEQEEHDRAARAKEQAEQDGTSSLPIATSLILTPTSL